MLKLHYRSFSNVYVDDIAEMICQIYHLHFEKYYIQQQHDLNLRYLC